MYPYANSLTWILNQKGKTYNTQNIWQYQSSPNKIVLLPVSAAFYHFCLLLYFLHTIVLWNFVVPCKSYCPISKSTYGSQFLWGNPFPHWCPQVVGILKIIPLVPILQKNSNLQPGYLAFSTLMKVLAVRRIVSFSQLPTSSETCLEQP